MSKDVRYIYPVKEEIRVRWNKSNFRHITGMYTSMTMMENSAAESPPPDSGIQLEC